VLGFSFLCHATANHRADRDEGEPLPFDLRQPGFEGGERRVVEMADGDRAAMPPARFARALCNRGGGLIVVEKHVASSVRNTVGDREPNARAGRGGRESRNARPRACNSSMTGAMLFASAVNLLPI
jgi:hypothetical protein